MAELVPNDPLMGLAANLTAAGQELVRTLPRGVRDAADVVARDVRKAARAEGLAKAAEAVETAYGRRQAAVYVARSAAPYAASRPFRHPVYGNRDVWVTQTAQSGFFYRATSAATQRRVEAKFALVAAAALRKAG